MTLQRYKESKLRVEKKKKKKTSSTRMADFDGDDVPL